MENINVSSTIDDYRSKLINEILFTTSQDEIQSFVYAAVKRLKENNVHTYIIRRFVDKTLEKLNEFNPDDYNSQQFANVKTSKIVLNKFKTSLSHV
jgi:hypothetical protein